MQLDEIKTKVEHTLRKYSVSEAYIFGSTARGERTLQSDIDILVSFKKLDGLFEFIRIKQDLEQSLGGIEVDLVQNEAMRPELREYIEKDKIKIF